MQGKAPAKEAAPPEEKAGDQLPSQLPPEIKWDLEVVRDLLELASNGEKVTWPEGLDSESARKLLQSGQPSKNM